VKIFTKLKYFEQYYASNRIARKLCSQNFLKTLFSSPCFENFIDNARMMIINYFCNILLPFSILWIFKHKSLALLQKH